MSARATGQRAADRPPTVYEDVRHPDGRLCVWSGARDVVESILSRGTLYEWAASQEGHSVFPGRGQVFAVPAVLPGPDGRERWAVRHYWRGGAMAQHMRDRYLRVGRARPLHEAAASTEARRRGVSTPAVIAAATYTDGWVYRCDLVTEVVPDVETLATTLHRHDGTKGWLVAMARAGALIRRLASVGVHHVDLNAHNILLADDTARGIWVVDLDRARIVRGPSERARARMQDRLGRSVAKIGTPTGERLKHAEIERALDRSPESL